MDFLDQPLNPKLKTIVELFDEKSQKRKKFVYDGFVSKENVLEALYQNGYIQKMPDSNANNEVENSHTGAVVLGQISDPKIEDNKIIEIDTKSNKDRNLNEEDQAEEKESFFDITTDPFVLLNSKKKSSSAMALVDTESVERISRFLKLHYRVAPYALNRKDLEEINEVNNKTWFQKILSCFCTWCTK